MRGSFKDTKSFGRVINIRINCIYVILIQKHLIALHNTNNYK